MKITPLSVILLLGGMVIFTGCRTSRGGYESAHYIVVRSDGEFELRNYPALTIAETQRTERSNSSFNRLFRFITGRNEGNQKIAMTTPVFVTDSSMAFVMPKDLAKVPTPTDGSVTIKQMPPASFAVLRFSGRRSRSQEEQALAKLKAWMTEQSYPVLSQPIYGYFDPPWTPTFLRRNEVMLQTESPPSSK